jgi:hypothetical protein
MGMSPSQNLPFEMQVKNSESTKHADWLKNYSSQKVNISQSVEMKIEQEKQNVRLLKTCEDRVYECEFSATT